MVPYSALARRAPDRRGLYHQLRTSSKVDYVFMRTRGPTPLRTIGRTIGDPRATATKGEKACNTHIPLSLLLAAAYLTGQWQCTFDVDSSGHVCINGHVFFQLSSSSNHFTSILQDNSP